MLLPLDHPTRQAHLAEHDAQMRARKEAVFLNEAGDIRRALMDQLVSIYSRKPVDVDEFRTLATAELGDSEYVDRITQRITGASASVPPPLARPDVGESPKKGFRTWFVVVNVLLLATVVAYIMIRRFRRKPG